MFDIDYFDHSNLMNRQGHTCSAIPTSSSNENQKLRNGKDVLIFGGFGFCLANNTINSKNKKKANNIHKRLNDLVLYSADTNSFKTIETFGELPTPRERHSAIICWHLFPNELKSKLILIIFGGRSNPQTFFNDIHFLDCETQKQTIKSQKLVFNKSWPTPRCRHTATYIPEKHQMLIFGGKSYSEYQSNNEIQIYDLDKEYQKLIPDNNFEKPAPRHSHATVYLNNELFIYGGLCGVKEFFDSSVQSLNIDTQKQRKICVNSNKIPSPRYSHTLTLMPDKFPNSFLLIGGTGLWISNLDKFGKFWFTPIF